MFISCNSYLFTCKKKKKEREKKKKDALDEGRSRDMLTFCHTFSYQKKNSLMIMLHILE